MSLRRTFLDSTFAFVVPFITWFISVINGEKATLETPTFAQKRRRTLDMLIRSLHQDLTPDLHKVTRVLSYAGSELETQPRNESWETRRGLAWILLSGQPVAPWPVAGVLSLFPRQGGW